MVRSKIFLGNRALGYVSNHIPAVTRYIQRRKENLIVTCVGRAFHTYGCSHFTLLSVSDEHPGEITALAADTYHVYTASENTVYAWRRGTEQKHAYRGHACPVHILLPFGPHLLSVDESSHVRMWDIKTEICTTELSFSNDVFRITALFHPSTYINKILLGSEQGQLQLWNVKTTRMIYTFAGWNSPITALRQAPAIDVAAIGFASGKIALHNLKLDVTLFELVQDWGPVTAIAFRSDGHPLMATGSPTGHVVFWNLEKRRVESQLSRAHAAAVTGLECLPNEPLLVTSSPDNSLKLWIFDLADGAARLLRLREGHAEQPSLVRFYGANGDNMLTAGGDSSLRIFSTVTEIFNKSLGRASYNRKASKKKGRSADDPLIMPPITELAYETTREKEWDNIVAAHLGLGAVTTWSYDKLRMGEIRLLPERFRGNANAVATALCVTQCGNFALIGYSTGHAERFNLQSGIHRATYGGELGAHAGPVRGVAVDALNRIVLTAGRDAVLRFWHFKPGRGTEPKSKIALDESVEWLRTHRDSALIALALEDFSVVLVDFETGRSVRRFRGHAARLTDATFSPDARWLVTASMDRTIRTWDIPSGHLVDVFRVPEACISLNFSPTGEYLASAHVCHLGIHLWSNRTLYSHVSLKAIPPEAAVPAVALPGVSRERGGGGGGDESEDEQDANALDNDYVSPEQLDDRLVTMSSLATSRWQNLLNIDVVKRRNRPKEPPKAPPAAPFFLPTIPSLRLQFDLSETASAEEGGQLLTHPDFRSLTPFGKRLERTVETEDFAEVMELLKRMGPSAIDFEIRSLTLEQSGAAGLLLQFMRMIRSAMRTRRDFELAHAYLAAFLRTHGERIAEEESLRDFLRELRPLQMEGWSALRAQLFYNLSVVQHLKTA